MTRETLHLERLAGRGEEQVTIEGEATLPGSMRDAVTVLSVQAQAHIASVQSGMGEAIVRGRVQFQVLYTQGDLTRIRTLETGCDFEHPVRMPGVTMNMRVCGSVAVQETQGLAASGRMTLRAMLDIQTEAFEAIDRDFVIDIHAPGGEEAMIQKRIQTIAYCTGETLGENRSLVREEFDLPARLGTGEVLSAAATATADDFSGGNGRIGVSGVIQVRVLHRPTAAGAALVSTQHDLPYDLTIDAHLPEGATPHAIAEVTDVMADSAESGEGRLLRVEAEVRVVLSLCRQGETQLLEDVYSVNGPVIEPTVEEIDVHTSQTISDVRESTRLQIALPADAPPMDTVLAVFVQPTIAEMRPAGRRLDVDGIMNVTLMYLPVDSDIPRSAFSREPFSMTFPVEAGEDVRAQAYAIEAMPGPSTSDRVEVRCVLGLRTSQHGVQRVRGVTGIEQKPPQKQEHGFVLVWPREGESRWETARRLRLAPESLKPAGGQALLAFRK